MGNRLPFPPGHTRTHAAKGKAAQNQAFHQAGFKSQHKRGSHASPTASTSHCPLSPSAALHRCLKMLLAVLRILKAPRGFKQLGEDNFTAKSNIAKAGMSCWACMHAPHATGKALATSIPTPGIEGWFTEKAVVHSGSNNIDLYSFTTSLRHTRCSVRAQQCEETDATAGVCSRAQWWGEFLNLLQKKAKLHS